MTADVKYVELHSTEDAFVAVKNDGTYVAWGQHGEGASEYTLQGDERISAIVTNRMAVAALIRDHGTPADGCPDPTGCWVKTWGDASSGGSMSTEPYDVASYIGKESANLPAQGGIKTVHAFQRFGFAAGPVAIPGPSPPPPPTPPTPPPVVDGDPCDIMIPTITAYIDDEDTELEATDWMSQSLCVSTPCCGPASVCHLGSNPRLA